MRKLIFVLAVAALVFTGVAIASNDGGGASGSSRLTVHNVFGLQTLEMKSFTFAANQVDGEANGAFHYVEEDDGVPFTAEGHVICAAVSGNDAWVGAVIDRSNDPTVVGLGSWWHVTDNGNKPSDPADITTFLGIGSIPDTYAYCADTPAYRHPFAIDAGAINVR
jgi:hypothetical protein